MPLKARWQEIFKVFVCIICIMGLLENAWGFPQTNYLKTHLYYAQISFAKIIFVAVRYAYHESGGFLLMWRMVLEKSPLYFPIYPMLKSSAKGRRQFSKSPDIRIWQTACNFFFHKKISDAPLHHCQIKYSVRYCVTSTHVKVLVEAAFMNFMPNQLFTPTLKELKSINFIL